MKNQRVNVSYSAEWGEYRVPAPSGNPAATYYTDDKEDAIGTAVLQFSGGIDVYINGKLAFCCIPTA